MKKRIVILLLFVLGTYTLQAQTFDAESKKYFMEIALGLEFEARQKPRIHKWESNLRIYPKGELRGYLMEELDKIIAELNELLKNAQISLSLTKNETEANYILFLGTGHEYQKIEPAAAPYLKTNYGLFYVYWNGKGTIHKGSMYVDIYRAKSQATQKHLLREELTQSLGLMRDSEKYPKSIFYEPWTTTTEYTDLDKKIIQLLYHPSIKPGLTAEEVSRVLEKL